MDWNAPGCSSIYNSDGAADQYVIKWHKTLAKPIDKIKNENLKQRKQKVQKNRVNNS